MRQIAPGVFEGGAPGVTAPAVPTVSMRQAKLALLAAGKLAAVDAAIEAMSEPQRAAALIEWNSAGAVARDHASTALIGAAAGLTGAQIDELFEVAALIP